MDLKVNNETVFAATGGKVFDPTLPTVIFIHGASFDRTVWNLQTRYFAYHGYGVLALDLPGHGRSSGAPLDSIDDFVSWLFATMDSAGVQGAHIVGHSLGALIALAAAANNPDRVRGISLVGMAYPMPVGDPLLVPAEANDDVVTDRLVSWSFGQAASQGGNTVPGLWMTGIGTRVVEKTDDGVLFADLTACNNYHDGDAAAESVTCPVQFILGSKDMMTPLRSAKAFAGKFDNPDLEVISGAGHNLMIEHPDATLDALKRFIA